MDITRSSLLSTILYTALLVLLFWWGSDLSNFYHPMEDLMIFGANWDMTSSIFRGSATFERISAAVLTFEVSLQVTRLAIRNIIFLERTYMPAVIFVIISASFYNTEYSLSPLIATFFLVLSFSQGLRSYPIKVLASRRMLTAGFYFGVAAFVYPPAAYMLPVVLIMVAMFRLGNFKEWVVLIVGILLPLGIYLFTLWVMQRDVQFAISQYHRALVLNDGTLRALVSQPLNLVQYTFATTVFTLFVLAIIRFLRNSKQYKRRAALGFGFFVFAAIWSAAVMFVSPVRSLYMLPFMALSLSIVLPTYFAGKRPTFWSNFLYALLLFSSIAVHFL